MTDGAPLKAKDIYRRRGNGKARQSNGGANLGFEEKLWQAADKLRSTAEAKRLEVMIRTNLKELGYDR